MHLTIFKAGQSLVRLPSVSRRNSRKLHEDFIGPQLGERCVAELSNPATDLGRQAHAFTHHLADLSMDLLRAQQRAGVGAHERRPEDPQAPGDGKPLRVPDGVDAELLARLQHEGIYHGPAP